MEKILQTVGQVWVRRLKISTPNAEVKRVRVFPTSGRNQAPEYSQNIRMSFVTSKWRGAYDKLFVAKSLCSVW